MTKFSSGDDLGDEFTKIDDGKGRKTAQPNVDVASYIEIVSGFCRSNNAKEYLVLGLSLSRSTKPNLGLLRFKDEKPKFMSWRINDGAKNTAQWMRRSSEAMEWSLRCGIEGLPCEEVGEEEGRTNGDL
ncbi:hypothetical protein Tco_1047976 [Tanacetum coccineum]